MLRCTFLLVIPLFLFTGCGDLEPDMQDTRTVILNMDFHGKSSSRSSSSVSASDLSQYNTHLILALPSWEEDLTSTSSYKDYFYSSFAKELMNPSEKKVSLEIPLNTQMKSSPFCSRRTTACPSCSPEFVKLATTENHKVFPSVHRPIVSA